ncbi:MAG: sensor domain-containing diguanylate cyclase, partial [Candidatus Omnitrophica bacterium]|nr:sensor domain-containing diguanylate cyclase [Candidatus Omnitrophota bacterium]
MIPAFIGCILFVIFRKLQLNKFSNYQGEFDRKHETINLLTESIREKKNLLQTLPFKCQRVSFLFNVSQRLIEIIESSKVLNFLIKTLEELFPQADNILIFDFDKENYSMNLARSFNKKKSNINEKKGDELDNWVLRHNCSLMIEDLTKEFKFDYSKIEAYTKRGARSFIASPLSIGNKILGVVKIESRNPQIFTLDDSRILRNICDLGAVVLERAELFSHARDLVIRDSLTSLFVKDYFFKMLKEKIKAAKTDKKMVGVMMLDIDDFKLLNDNYGHTIGDAALRTVAEVLSKISDVSGNLAARFGGEEFIIYIGDCNKKELLIIAEKIRMEIKRAVINFRREKVYFTISLGAVLYPNDGVDFISLVDKADNLLYKAKKEGKD